MKKLVLSLLALLILSIGIIISISFFIPDQLKQDGRTNQSYLFRNIGLLTMNPGDGKEIQWDKIVHVENGRIKGILPKERAELLKNYNIKIIDGNGAILMPGLIDSHVHVWDEAELAGYLIHGVTSIRNMSGMPMHLKWINKIKKNELLAPDLMTSSPIINSPGPNQQINHILLSDEKMAREQIRILYRMGYRLIKVYSNLHKEIFDAIIDEAAKKKMKITGHTPEGKREKGIPGDKDFQIPFSFSLKQNFQSIEHIESIVWHGLRDQLDEMKMNQLAKEIADSKTPVTSTLIAHANLVRVAKTKGQYLHRLGTESINPLLKIAEKDTYEFWSNMDPLPREIPRAEFYLKSAKILFDNGVVLLAGSDAGIFTNIPGSALTRELELLVKAEIPPYEVIKMATVNPANSLDLKLTGQIKAGYKANMILLKGNPLTEINAVENPIGVMIHGQWLEKPQLEILGKVAKSPSLLRSLRHLVRSFI